MANFPYQDAGTITLESGVTCPNPFVILTNDNVVQLLGRLNVASLRSGMLLCVLPTFAWPANTIRIPVNVNTTSKYTSHLRITENGNVYIEDATAGSNKIIYTEGLNYNISSRFYNSTLGNNIPDMPTEGNYS